MTVSTFTHEDTGRATRLAVLSMALCVAVLIASEFLPVSLLTPIAADMGVTEGHAGQAISISGLFAVITSLTIARATRGLDRRRLQLGLTTLLVVSGVIVTFAPNYPVLMFGRALLGVAIGGFWSMSTAIVMRLLPAGQVPQGLAALNAGNAIAATVAAPMGSWLGDLIGWRGAFFLIVPLALLALLCQWLVMPSLPAEENNRTGGPFGLLARAEVSTGMAAIFFLFMGQFALFTYLRPFLEGVAGFSVPELSLVLLLIGIAGVAGTWAISRLLKVMLFPLLIGIPLAMAGIAALLLFFAQNQIVVALLLLSWGLFATAAPVGWGTWLARTLHRQAELGGGLQVAVIQLAIMSGAAIGGLIFDAFGWAADFILAAALLLAASVAALLAARIGRRT
ncbi:MFS transporter (plasmid) [Gemmobacter fulvus]|uniref:MFS transporter n=1 Tax=Gemmobacter fulvus TaxID=2840474 RepID=A0A975S3I5_9RHOB|nr:MFS transporter [Gemmobacter fulvus]MBT9246105.1 MFS transporter [Gemmobacter fulvus]QWK92138.1 MFS transporter [Gemmobacter fulvus]